MVMESFEKLTKVLGNYMVVKNKNIHHVKTNTSFVTLRI